MRRFPPPWTVQAIDAGFKVIDLNGQALAYVYGHADKRDAETAKGLTLDEASTHSEQHREAEGLGNANCCNVSRHCDLCFSFLKA